MTDITGETRGGWHVYLIIIATLCGALGICLAIGGIWLIVLGGSWYYALGGIGLVVCAALMFQRRMAAVWVYLILFALTVAWALWERGFTFWPQVPRILGPLVLLVLILTTIPALRQLNGPRYGTRIGTLVVALLGGLALLGVAQPQAVPAQVAEEPTPEVVEPTPEVVQPAPETVEPAPETEPVEPVPEVVEPAPQAAAAEPLETGTDWPAYGGTHGAQRYTPLDQITPANVADLEQVWAFRTGDLPGEGSKGYSPENTPLKIGNTVFVCSAMGMVIGLDAATGAEEWRHDPEVSPDAIPYGATCRGVAHYTDPAANPDAPCASRVLWGTLDARLIAVDAQTGNLCADFGTGGEVDLETGIGETVPGWYSVTSAPTLIRGVAVMGAQVKDGQAEDAPSGVVRGFDAATGELAWAWDLGNPELTGLPAEGEVYTRGTPNMWTTASADEDLGLVYLPMGNSSVDYYGSLRSEEENLYATALVALDGETGAVVWSFQTVHNDVWDYDLGGQATLVDFPQGDATVPALIIPSKQGDIYVLDRATGESLTDVEERPVPQGGVEPDYLSPTQPFSAYHTLAKRDLTEADMWGFTLVDQLYCRIKFRQAAYEGIYTAPTADQHWIQYPGYNGGSDWGGVAVDPERGIIIANYNDMPNHNRLIPREEADAAGLQPINAPGGPDETPLGEAGPQIGAPYAIQVNAGWRVPFTGLLCKEPPYGGLRAIDLATGETLWDQPFGSARKNGPFGIPSYLPLTIGTPNNGGAVVTASGLIFIGATTDDLFRAIDISTGETVWDVALPGGGQSNPFMFEVDGRQFVGIMAGGHHFMETPVGDHVLTWALPE